MDSNTFAALSAFRHQLYACFFRAGDALMNTADALLTDSTAKSFVQLSLAPCFERGWPSLYKAFQNAVIDRAGLQGLFARFAPLPSEGRRLVLGVDASSIARPLSQTARDRTYVHASNLPEGCQPVVAGWQFSTLSLLPETPSSWTYVLDNQRIPSTKTQAEMAAQQIETLLPLLPACPLLLGDGYYGSATFLRLTNDLWCDKLLRLAKNRVLYRPAPPRPEKPGPGAPKKDGTVFKCQDAATHAEPDALWEGVDEQGHSVTVACWHNLHFKEARDVSVSVLQVSRQSAKDTKRDPKVSWFVFAGQQMPPLEEVPRLYARRYSVEHAYRVDKQDLLWEQVRLRRPEAFQHWTDMVACVRNQLCLSRYLALARQPWERNARCATPSQVRRAMGGILRQLGTPARVSQVRGNSPGRQKGAVIPKAPRYKVVYKATDKPKKKPQVV